MIHEDQILEISQPQNPKKTFKNTSSILSFFGAFSLLLLVSIVTPIDSSAANHLPIHPYFSLIDIDHHSVVDDNGRFYPIAFGYDANPAEEAFIKSFSGFHNEKMDFNSVLSLSKLNASFLGTKKWATPLEQLPRELKELPLNPAVETLDFVKANDSEKLPERIEAHYETITQSADLPHLQNLEEVSLDFADLVAEAKAQDKMFFLQFGASWCGPCKKMKKYMKEDLEVKSYIENNYLHMMVDVEDFDGVSLKMLFEVNMLPTIIIFDSNGEIVRKYEEAFSAESFLEVLDYHNDRPTVEELPFVGPIDIRENNTTVVSFDWGGIDMDELVEQMAYNRFTNYTYELK